MAEGYNGKIAKIDLGRRSVSIEEPEESLYRKYLGGRGLGVYYLFRDLKPKIDPLGPENELIFATSVITGIPISGMSRYSVVAKSPLTGGYGEAEAGGFFGSELKAAGFDVLIVQGYSKNPIYLWIQDGKVEFMDASALWGQSTKETQDEIRRNLKDPLVRVALIGPAGENLVRYACILNELKFANGRGGLGAVMGSKKLKAIAVRGHKRPQPKNLEKIDEIGKWMVAHWKDFPGAVTRSTYGTADSVMPLDAGGILPTKNFQGGSFAKAENISGETMKNTILTATDGCYACLLRCKRKVVASRPRETDPAYGGPEYETIAAFGSLCEIDDLNVIAKANQLCNAYSIDTISAGNTIAFAMECYEKGLLKNGDTGGMKLQFGNADAMLQLLEMIAYRKGVGNLLAEGVKKASDKIGRESSRFAMHVKGQELPMHDPRGKAGLGLAYAVSPTGADHLQHAHDPVFIRPSRFMETFGLTEGVDPNSLGPEKVRLFVYAQLWWSLLDCLGACKFIFVPHNAGVLNSDHLVELVNATTGWNTSLWSLMKASERALNLAGCFNLREGFTAADDKLPERFFEELAFGSRKGSKLDKKEFDEALHLYYEMMGWNRNTRVPTVAKLDELDLDWAAKEIGIA
jgi:aldehyde:ferredoxin oxidoreductase